MQLLGEFPVSIDNKGRLRVPTALLRQLGEPSAEAGGYEFVVTRGFEGALSLYPQATWKHFEVRLSQLNRHSERQRKLMRFIYSGATYLVTDSADRILLPKPLMEHAGLSDEAILLAMQNYIEIWSPERYQQNVLMTDPEDITDLADEVLGSMEDSKSTGEREPF